MPVGPRPGPLPVQPRRERDRRPDLVRDRRGGGQRIARPGSSSATWAFTTTSNGLASLRALAGPVRVVVLNNDGGGIFEFLPQADQIERGEFEALLGTPLGVEPARIAAHLRPPPLAGRRPRPARDGGRANGPDRDPDRSSPQRRGSPADRRPSRRGAGRSARRLDHTGKEEAQMPRTFETEREGRVLIVQVRQPAPQLHGPDHGRRARRPASLARGRALARRGHPDRQARGPVHHPLRHRGDPLRIGGRRPEHVPRSGRRLSADRRRRGATARRPGCARPYPRLGPARAAADPRRLPAHAADGQGVHRRDQRAGDGRWLRALARM